VIQALARTEGFVQVCRVDTCVRVQVVTLDRLVSFLKTLAIQTHACTARGAHVLEVGTRAHTPLVMLGLHSHVNCTAMPST